MKYLIAITLLLCYGNLFAQPNTLPLIMRNAPEKAVESSFNRDTIHYEQRQVTKDGRYLFISYKKTDTLNFNHPFYKNGDNWGYVAVGLALYEKEPTAYRLKWTNDNVFFCATCNNVGEQFYTVHEDTVTVGINWGPSVAWEYNQFIYIYDKASHRWRLHAEHADGDDDTGEIHRLYLVFSPGSNLYLDNVNAETTEYDYDPKTTTAVLLSYRNGKYKALLDSLKTFPAKHYPYLEEVFPVDAANNFFDDETTPPMIPANNIGYFFEQANALNIAKIFLDKVISVYPDREVAYYNRGDVYRKKGMTKAAVQDYEAYIRLMNKRGLQAKIPKAVSDYVTNHK